MEADTKSIHTLEDILSQMLRLVDEARQAKDQVALSELSAEAEAILVQYTGVISAEI